MTTSSDAAAPCPDSIELAWLYSFLPDTGSGLRDGVSIYIESREYSSPEAKVCSIRYVFYIEAGLFVHSIWFQFRQRAIRFQALWKSMGNQMRRLAGLSLHMTMHPQGLGQKET